MNRNVTVSLWVIFSLFVLPFGLMVYYIHNSSHWKDKYQTLYDELGTIERTFQSIVSVMRSQLHYLYGNSLSDNSELICLASNIFFEAGNQNYDGKVAVAAVTINRVNSNRFPDTICEVVYQRNLKGCQFSWVCEDNNFVPIPNDSYREAFYVAVEVMSGTANHVLFDIPNALWYHADYVDPWWNADKNKVAIIGRHIFYEN